MSYELESVVIDKSDVCDDAVATLSYKLKNASSSALTNYGLTSLTITKTIPTSITPKELQVDVTMPSCHVFDGNVNVSAAELIAKLSKIASPDGVLDDVRLTLVSATLDDPNVGDNHTLTINYALAGDKAKNYTLPNGGVFVIKNVEVCAKELEVKGSLVFNDHVYDCGTNAKADVASYPYVELGTERVYLQFSTDDYAIITNKNCGEHTVNTRLHLVGLPNYTLKGGVGENGDMIILSEPIRITKRPLTLDGLGKATNHEYDCSKTYNGSITVPGLSNVSCSENVSLRVVSSVFSQVPDTQGPQNLTVTYDLDGAASVISNYYLVDNKQVLKVMVSPKPVTVRDPVFDTPLSHKFECGNPDDVSKEYLEIYPEELEVIGYCGDNNSRLFFRLQSAKITDADKTPGDGRETTVVYKLDCDDAFNISNYVGLERNREFKISTNILKPAPASYVEPLFTPVSHQYVCGETGDVTYEFNNSKFDQIKVSGVCDYVVNYVLESAQVIDKDLTPSDNLKTRVVYKLVANSAEFDPEDFSLPASITYETALTNITKPAKATFSWPLFSPVPHQYICDGEAGDVTNEFMAVAAYNRIPVSGVCGQDVYYQLVKAQINGSDFTPSDNKKTTLTYSLVIPAGYDADDFGLSPNVVYAEALTNVTKPDPAQFIKPVFTPVDHQYVCAENGDVTADYLKTHFKSILVSNVCGQMASYELKSATVISSDLTPASNLPTRVVYEINMPVGYDHDMYGLAKTLTYTDALTNITKPDPAVVSSPVFAPVAHVFECNDNGDVTSEYKKQYGSIDISDICGYHAQYVLESAQIIGGEFTPKDGRPTKVVYRLVMPTGYDADDYGLDQVISFSDALTNVLKPEPAKFGRPDFSVVNVPYQCDFDGNVTANYAEAGYGVINVTGVCGSDVKYVLDEAHILGSDFSPAEGLQTKVRYILSAPSGFNPDIYGLANSLNFDNATSTILKPTPAFVELPSFVAVDHKYVCGEDGDVTADYLKSRFATVRVSDICGKSVYYKLRQATVMSSDLMPADALPTTVLYELVMPQGFDAEDFGLKSELYMTDALTNITKPDPASFTKPTFFAVKHKYACDDDGVVTNDFKSTSLNRIDVNGVCDAEVYYEIEKAEISDKSNLLPAAGVHTTVTYSLHYPQDFDPADFSLESTLVYYDALTDITPSDDAKFEAPVFNVVNHQFKCGETGVVTDEYKAIAGINKLFVSGICRDDVYYEIESAVVSDKSDLTPADNLQTQSYIRSIPQTLTMMTSV
ncbi:MAG: YDG domain-containing protein [Bacteroidales bacterium]|nr:YDG domain-containing protein [Bacteroidales bacterium]